MEIVYVLVGIVALVAVYFLFLRKPEPEKLEAPPKRELPEKKEEAAKKREEPKPRPAAEKAAAKAEPAKEPEAGERAEPKIQEAEIPVEAEAPAEPSRPSLTHARDVAGLRKGLAKSRSEEGFFGKLKALISGKKEISPAIAEEIEEILLASDVGVPTTQAMLARIKETLSKADLLDSARVWDAVRDEAKRILDVDGKAGAFPLRGSPTVVLMVGVNGAGKTTTIGKLATKLRADGKQVVLAAADTFRAAAVQQLVVWGERVGCEVVRGKDGADPGSVVFDAIKKAQESGADVVLADTAGRLHTKTNLMAEMKKIAKTADKALSGAPHEVLLVVDATNGQNALAQAKEFKEQLELTGIVLTKLDGTAKGGVILGICDTFGVPVRFVGLGERPDDLRDFSPDEFVEALLGQDSEASAA
ncbi:MAG: signal recognition particle-docking protein FtsY [Polyangiaceae bacterium]|nr:signal recognition particle-docking protein FtsY [Polyangiaceae bacterium]MCE7889026.1 signal recognition particle-docking protein FtsY [Sorangiineae bacterium PRO1]MCL4753141.1 signal recognition particle-docking protein FtsY [Myxococcales bacterium]